MCVCEMGEKTNETEYLLQSTAVVTCATEKTPYSLTAQTVSERYLLTRNITLYFYKNIERNV